MQTKSGKDINPIGIGTWGILDYHPMDETEAISALQYSLSKGQNHVDCAQLYGNFQTDELVGKALQGAVREDLFIADKLWETSLLDGAVRPTVEKMFEKLQTDYLDLLYIHWPFPGVRWQEAIPQIDALIDEGLVRNFGVSNFSVDQMKEAQSLAKHPIAANQMKYNVLYKTEVDLMHKEYCKQNGIKLVAYQPVKRGAVVQNYTIQEVAKDHNATPAQIAIAWLLAEGALTIPKATQKSHIDENLGALNITLSQEEIELLERL